MNQNQAVKVLKKWDKEIDVADNGKILIKLKKIIMILF
jgi:hypothetical protein